ncbi:hypothetical protein HA466_0083670 [Hirschfeldia incana]|nr:hypothetical protein HA466_0083670 [Hirschfeldia incana]
MEAPWSLPSLPSSSSISSALISLPPSPITTALPQQTTTSSSDETLNPICSSPSVEPSVPTEDSDSTMLDAPALNLLDPNSFPALAPLPTIRPPIHPTTRPPTQPNPPNPNPPQTFHPQHSNPSPPPVTTANWAKNLKKSVDRSLKKVSNPTFSAEGIPRIKVPDSVFKKGADLHQDFVLGIFLGKTPSFSQIQSVLTHIWGKGMKLETHLRPETRSMLVRIPNAELRKKIVEQEFWHIGNVLFYVAQWSDSVAMKPPAFTTMPLWAHFKGIPFDLYTQEGLGRVGDLLGHPIEVDEFTRRMTNINVTHIKCRVDITKPLPKFGELERENGEVVTVSIDYPWVPPICTCCGELGHLQSHCPSGTWKAKQHAKSPNEEKSSSSSPPEINPVSLPEDAPVAPPPLASIPVPVTHPDLAHIPVPAPQSPQNSLASPEHANLGRPEPVFVPPSETFGPPLSSTPPNPLCLDSDGSIISPPPSPRCNRLDHPHVSPPISPLSSPPPILFKPDNRCLHPNQITHLVALPAIHHPRPIKTSTFRKATSPLPFPESKFPLSVNPFALLEPEPSSPPLARNPSLPSSTNPSEGSLLSAGVKPTL